MSNPIQQAIDGLTDILNGWKYIRDSHGDLYGVGWDRAQDKAEAALSALQSLQGVELPPLPEPYTELYKDLTPVLYEAWSQQMQAYARAAVAAAMARGVATDMYCTCGNEWQWNTDVGSWELVASFIPDEVSDVAQPTQAEAPSEPKRAYRENPEPLSEFDEGQWWVHELDKLARDARTTDDQKRAVAVVHHLLASARAALATQQAGQGETAASVVNNQFTRAWLQLDELPGGMMMCNGEPFGPVPASTSCWITTSERERDRLVAEGHNMLAVYTHPAPQQPEALAQQERDKEDAPCPDGLLPDGEICPRCGGKRGPSGIDGGSWVHIRAARSSEGGGK